MSKSAISFRRKTILLKSIPIVFKDLCNFLVASNRLRTTATSLGVAPCNVQPLSILSNNSHNSPIDLSRSPISLVIVLTSCLYII